MCIECPLHRNYLSLTICPKRFGQLRKHLHVPSRWASGEYYSDERNNIGPVVLFNAHLNVWQVVDIWHDGSW